MQRLKGFQAVIKTLRRTEETSLLQIKLPNPSPTSIFTHQYGTGRPILLGDPAIPSFSSSSSDDLLVKNLAYSKIQSYVQFLNQLFCTFSVLTCIPLLLTSDILTFHLHLPFNHQIVLIRNGNLILYLDSQTFVDPVMILRKKLRNVRKIIL